MILHLNTSKGSDEEEYPQREQREKAAGASLYPYAENVASEPRTERRMPSRFCRSLPLQRQSVRSSGNSGGTAVQNRPEQSLRAFFIPRR